MKKVLAIAAMLVILAGNALGFEFAQTGKVVKKEVHGYYKVEINNNFFAVSNPQEIPLVKGQMVVVVFTVDTDSGELIESKIVYRMEN